MKVIFALLVAFTALPAFAGGTAPKTVKILSSPIGPAITGTFDQLDITKLQGGTPATSCQPASSFQDAYSYGGSPVLLKFPDITYRIDNGLTTQDGRVVTVGYKSLAGCQAGPAKGADQISTISFNMMDARSGYSAYVTIDLVQQQVSLTVGPGAALVGDIVDWY